ncbi:MAG: DUF2927 domain-containing protein [Pseudomonadota bacterium]
MLVAMTACPTLAPLSRWLVTLTLLLGLAACSDVGSREYFQQSDEALRQAGKLRTDRVARDVSYGNADLVEHFLRVAFGEEYTLEGSRYVPLTQRGDAPLKRWGNGLRYWVETDGTRTDDIAVEEFAERLARTTRLSITEARSQQSANLVVHFLDRSGRDRVEDRLSSDADQSQMLELFTAWRDTPEWPCASEFYYQPRNGSPPYQIEFAVIYIRDELSGISRQSCIEEEMSQALGLARDDPTVRPSIFNDDEEFALLTEHDALLLRILYDPRLRPGLTQAEALPIVQRVVGDLRPWAK